MAFPKVDLTDVVSFIDHHLSDDRRTDLGIKDEWLNIPDLNIKKVTMVIKIIIGIIITSQMSEFGHLWHAHPQR